MRRKRTFWLDAYRETLEERKQGPDFKLIECLDRTPKGPVLNLGMGRDVMQSSLPSWVVRLKVLTPQYCPRGCLRLLRLMVLILHITRWTSVTSKFQKEGMH